MPLFTKQERPRFFGGLLGQISRKLAPLAGTGLGAYLGGLSANPYLSAAGSAGGHYIGQKGGDALAKAFEDYMPFANGGSIPRKKKFQA